jgi:hypothetical protein
MPDLTLKGENPMNHPRFPSSCYTTRASFRQQNTGAVFTFLAGERRWIPDLCLSHAQLSADATELKLVYASCVANLYGRRLDSIFEDAMSHHLGEVREGGIPDGLPRTDLWVTSMEILDPPGSIEDQLLEHYVETRRQSSSTLERGRKC